MTPLDHTGFALPAVAEATGPFSTAEFLSVASRYQGGEQWLAASEDALIPLCRLGEVIVFSGAPEVTDYHTSRGEGSEALVASVADEAGPARFVLDSLPEEAAKPLAAGLAEAGLSVDTRIHEVAAVLHLPATVEEYMTSIGKKERHEVRRKRRRYERMMGEVVHETHRGTGWAFEEFLRLHRVAGGEKGDFMTEDREAMFVELAGLDGWRVDLLRVGDERAASVVFGYADSSGYYLYNSGYDPEFGEASPGVVLLGSMIELAIGEEMPRFDFLKGDESYKFRLGAGRRPLVEIVATREAPT